MFASAPVCAVAPTVLKIDTDTLFTLVEQAKKKKNNNKLAGNVLRKCFIVLFPHEVNKLPLSMSRSLFSVAHLFKASLA